MRCSYADIKRWRGPTPSAISGGFQQEDYNLECTVTKSSNTWIVDLEKHALLAGRRFSLLCDTIAGSANFYKLSDVHSSLLWCRLWKKQGC